MHKKFFKKRLEVVNEKEREMYEKYGWFVHYVFETREGELNGLANVHTHGVLESFGHMDFQIVLPMSPQTLHPVLSQLVNDVKEGRTFEPDKPTPEVLKGYDVLFVECREGNRQVLRLILPDPHGKFPLDDGCEPIYARQLEVLPLQ